MSPVKSTPATLNRSLMLLALIMMVNALSYGVMVPLLYPYAARFGLNAIGLGALFGSYALFQFLATPIIGRLSDKYGRKPLLLGSFFGTSLSLALFAMANSIPMLFVSRILDGITGGNNSVAHAIIADITTGKERTKAFGFLGAAFGVGFLFGPAVGGLLSTISLTAPFWFGSAIALVGTLLGMIVLPETLPAEAKLVHRRPQALLDIGALWGALRLPSVGAILLVTLLSMTAHQAMVLGFQSFTVDVLGFVPAQIGLLFSGIGIISVVMQAGGIRLMMQLSSERQKILKWCLIASGFFCVLLAIQNSAWLFVPISLVYVSSFVPQSVMINSLLSEQTSVEDQGGIMGISQSFVSLGQIFGPLVAGGALLLSVHWVFIVAAVMFAVSAWASRRILVVPPLDI